MDDAAPGMEIVAAHGFVQSKGSSALATDWSWAMEELEAWSISEDGDLNFEYREAQVTPDPSHPPPALCDARTESAHGCSRTSTTMLVHACLSATGQVTFPVFMFARSAMLGADPEKGIPEGCRGGPRAVEASVTISAETPKCEAGIVLFSSSSEEEFVKFHFCNSELTLSKCSLGVQEIVSSQVSRYVEWLHRCARLTVGTLAGVQEQVGFQESRTCVALGGWRQVGISTSGSAKDRIEFKDFRLITIAPERHQVSPFPDIAWDASWTGFALELISEMWRLSSHSRCLRAQFIGTTAEPAAATAGGDTDEASQLGEGVAFVSLNNAGAAGWGHPGRSPPTCLRTSSRRSSLSLLLQNFLCYITDLTPNPPTPLAKPTTVVRPSPSIIDAALLTQCRTYGLVQVKSLVGAAGQESTVAQLSGGAGPSGDGFADTGKGYAVLGPGGSGRM
eukprot:1971363-Rhodomonas_salina.1